MMTDNPECELINYASPYLVSDTDSVATCRETVRALGVALERLTYLATDEDTGQVQDHKLRSLHWGAIQVARDYGYAFSVADNLPNNVHDFIEAMDIISGVVCFLWSTGESILRISRIVGIDIPTVEHILIQSGSYSKCTLKLA